MPEASNKPKSRTNPKTKTPFYAKYFGDDLRSSASKRPCVKHRPAVKTCPAVNIRPAVKSRPVFSNSPVTKSAMATTAKLFPGGTAAQGKANASDKQSNPALKSKI